MQKTQNSPEYEDEVANSSSFAIYASFFFLVAIEFDQYRSG